MTALPSLPPNEPQRQGPAGESTSARRSVSLARFRLMTALARGHTRREFDEALEKAMPGWTVQRIWQEVGR